MAALLRRHALASLPCRAAILAALLFDPAAAQGLQTHVTYPSDTTVGNLGNNAPLGRNGNGSTDEARAQILIPAQFLPPTGGTVVGIEMVNGAGVAGTLTYRELDIQAANLPLNPAQVPPALSPVFATNLGTAAVTVLSQRNSTITWPSRQWTRVTFTTPFQYRGGDHLVLDFQKAIACPATQSVYHLVAMVERTPLGTAYNLPIMAVSFGACGSNAHRNPRNTSAGGRYPPRVRVVFQGSSNQCVPTTVTSSGVPPNSFWILGSTFTLTTQASAGSWGFQLIDLGTPHLVLQTTPLTISGVLGDGWVRANPPPISLPTGFFTGPTFASTIGIPNRPSLAGLHVVFQSLVFNAPTLTPTWTNATDATLR